MLSRRQLILLLVLSVWWLTGCSTRHHVCSGTGGLTDVVEVAPIGRLLERGQIIPDVSEVVPSESDITPPERTQLYRVLSEAECQCAAAGHASVANLIDLENAIASCGNGKCRANQQQAAALQSELMAYRSASERNKAAAEAAELFFLLAEVEFGRDAVAQSLAEIDKIRDYMAQIRASGLDLNIAGSAVYNRRGELLDQKAKLALDGARLNSELRRRLGLDVDDQTPIWPDTDLKVQADQIDVDTAIAEGLAMRPDVAAMERLALCLDVKSLPHARSSLQAVDAVLGSATGKSCLAQFLGNSAKNCEAANRAEQLHQLLVHLQRAVAEEIRQAVHAVETRIQQIAIAKQRLANRQKALDDLNLQWGGPDVTAFQISDAKLKLVQAQTDLVHQVVAWEIAHVKLKQAQGLFAMECGYTQPSNAAAYDPADQEAPAAESNMDTEGDIAPPPAPPFAYEKPATLRQPESVAESDAADSRGPANDPSVPEGQPPKPLLQIDAPDNGSRTADEDPDPPDATTSLPPDNRQLPRDMVFGEKLSAAKEADSPAVAAPGVSGQTAETPQRFASVLRQPESLITAGVGRRNGDSVDRGNVENQPAAPRDTTPDRAARTPQPVIPGLRQPESIASAAPPPGTADVRARERHDTGLYASRSEASSENRARPQPDSVAIRQPASIAPAGRAPQITNTGTGSSGPIGKPVLPISISRGKLATPPVGPSGLRQPKSVVSTGAQPRVAGPVCGVSDQRETPCPRAANKDHPSPSGRTTVRQPMSFPSVEIKPDEPGALVRRARDQCCSTAGVVESSRRDPAAPRPTNATLQRPVSFARTAAQLPVESGAVDRPCDECESATGADRCPCSYARTSCVGPVSPPPRFVPNARRHLQPPRISGGCRSWSCQQVQCEQSH
jgi:hypothetical protein